MPPPGGPADSTTARHNGRRERDQRPPRRVRQDGSHKTHRAR